MKRLIAGLAVLVLAGLATACGQAAGPSGPAVTVAWAPDSGQLDGVYSATLTPTASPSGLISLKVVRDGRVRTLASYRFRGMHSPGAVRIRLASRAVDASWTLPGSGAGKNGGHVAIPPWSQASAESESSGAVQPDGIGEVIVWAHTHYDGSWPSASGQAANSFAALVSESVQDPRRTVYCLTLKVDAR
jgi:hypothetical protein